LFNGNLGIGSLIEFECAYEVPNLGPPADAGLSYFVQTSDGFLHTATSTSTAAGTGNGVNAYIVPVLANQFSPSLNSQSVNTLNIRYSNHLGGGTIFFLNQAEIEGSSGILGPVFSAHTLNDHAFNN